MLLNIGFGVTVVVAVVLLLVAFGVSWYSDHLAAAGSVNGQTITRDAFRKQFAINAFRNDYQNRRIRTLLTAGHLRTADAQARQSILQQRSQQAATISLEQLVDGDVMAQLAQPAERDRHRRRRRRPPRRRGDHPGAAPRLDDRGRAGARRRARPSSPTEAEGGREGEGRPGARRPQAGKDWETVAKAVSTDPTKAQGGDLGFIDKDAALDQPFVDALVAAAPNTPTAVDRGRGRHLPDRAGHRHRGAGRSTRPTRNRSQDAGIDLADYREALRRDVLRTKLSDAVLAGYLAASPQREVSEIWQQEGQSESGEGAIRVRHILYSPNDDPSAASTVAADRPRVGQGRAGRPRPPTTKLKADPVAVRRASPARRATRRRRSRPAASCRTSRPRTPSTRRSPRRSTRRASSRASCWSPSSRRSAGTSSRSCTTRPTSSGRTRSRPRSTAGR